jgi:hypothetical protein
MTGNKTNKVIDVNDPKTKEKVLKIERKIEIVEQEIFKIEQEITQII